MTWVHFKNAGKQTPSKLRATATEDEDPATLSIKLTLGSLGHASLQ